MAYSEAKKYDKAINAYKIALILKPKDEKILLNLGFIYSQKKDYKHALLVYRNVIKLNSENPDVYYYIGLLYIDMDRTTVWTNSLYLYSDKIVVKTFDHGRKIWMEDLERTFIVPELSQ